MACGCLAKIASPIGFVLPMRWKMLSLSLSLAARLQFLGHQRDSNMLFRFTDLAQSQATIRALRLIPHSFIKPMRSACNPTWHTRPGDTFASENPTAPARTY